MDQWITYVIEDNIFYYEDIIEGFKINIIYKIEAKRGKKR